MVRIISIRTAGLPSTLTGFSRARSPQTFPSSGQPRSSFSSTSGPPRCSGLKYRCLSSFVPTTWSSKSLRSFFVAVDESVIGHEAEVIRCLLPARFRGQSRQPLKTSGSVAQRRSVEAGARRAPRPPWVAALLGQHARGVVSFVYAPRAGGAYDSHHRTAGTAGRTRRCGGGVAARGPRAAGRDAGGWLSRCEFAWGERTTGS